MVVIRKLAILLISLCILMYLLSKADLNLMETNSMNESLRQLKINSFLDSEEIELYIQKENTKTYFKNSTNGENPIVDLQIEPKNSISPNSSNWTVTWSTTPNNLLSAWIGVYPFAQKASELNLYSKINIGNNINGLQNTSAPNDAGIFEIRYVQADAKFTIASSGPLTVNPRDSHLIVTKTELDLHERISIYWKLEGETLKKLIEGKDGNKAIETKLCLNIIGSYDYDDCYWSSELTSSKGKANLHMPKFAGYFVFRIISKYNTWKFLPEVECLLVSQIIKVSDSNINLTPTDLFTTVASTLEATWLINHNKFEPRDWIGIYSIESNIFSTSATPIASVKVNSSNGTFSSFIPPNTPAGSYVFVYFRNQNPIAVSDLIVMSQPQLKCPANNSTMSNIKHVVILCTENHSFDSYFGNYCQEEANSSPTCNQGRNCCEAAPKLVENQTSVVLNDTQNLKFDPDHGQLCESCEWNGGRMDGYLSGCFCSNPQNFAVADEQSVDILIDLASRYSLADRYFQPSVGASSQNDMFLARASYVFYDNVMKPLSSVGSNCWDLEDGIPGKYEILFDPTITNLLSKCDFVLKSYAEGYHNATKGGFINHCYPDIYDASDVPFSYYVGVADNPKHMGDYEDFKSDLINGTLPDVVFIKPLGMNNGHPGDGNISNETNFIKKTLDAVLASKYAEDTLVLWVPDESGGFYDHVTPPKPNQVDKIPYGARIPMLAMGKFAKKNYVSHVEMEHSSIVKFIEWNWFGKTGQLNTRDKIVNSIGDMIDPIQAGVHIPN